MGSELNFLIVWIPTILFCLILLFGFIKGILRGFRKSKITFIHSLVAGIICIVLFFLLTNLEFFDKLILDIVNSFAGNIQSQLGVSESITTFKGVLTEYIPIVLSETDPAIGSAFASNSTYLIALVNFFYNFVAVILCYVVYLVLRILLYLIYFIFYPERRYKKKWNKKYEKGLVPYAYKKRRLRGGVLSLCVSFISAIVFFSFFGNFLFVFAGSGEALPEHEFADNSTNETYQTVNLLEGYGENGVFKLLNLAKDSNGVPLYLYVSGIFYSSEYDNPLTGEKDRVFLTHELGNYVSFVKGTASLVLEYEGDSVDEIISGSEEFSEETLIKIFSNEQFRKEFRQLISDFSNNSSFVSNFVFSMLNSYAENIDQSTLINEFSPDVKEVLNIMFVEGYKSPYIEYENNYDGDALPYVKPSYLISKNDLLVAYDAFCELVDVGIFNEDVSPTQIIQAVSPFVKNLTMFNSSNENRKDINGVLSRVYSYFEIQMTGIDASDSIANYTKNNQVNWIDELVTLTEISPDICSLYDVVADGASNNKSTEDILAGIFANDKNLESYDNVLNFIVNSKLAATALSNGFIKEELENTLSSVIPNLVISDSLVFENTYDDKGNIKEYGELYYLLSSVKNICKDASGRKFIGDITSGQEVDYIKSIKSAENAFVTKDTKTGLSAIDCFAESELLRSITSAFLVDMAKGDNSVIYISDYALETNEDDVLTSLIKKEEYSLIINSLFDIMNLIPEDISTSEDPFGDFISSYKGNLFENETVMTLFEKSVIIQGTIGNLIIGLSNGDDSVGSFITLSEKLSSADGWISYDVSESEAYKFITTLYTVFGDSRLLNFDENTLTSTIQELSDDDKFNEIMDCEFLRYSVSDALLNALKESGLFDATVIDSCVGEDGLLLKPEIKAIIDFVNFSEIDVINGNFDKITNYTEDITKITEVRQSGEDFEGSSLLDVGYNSIIIKDYVNTTVDTALVNFASQYDLNKCKEGKYYAIDELNYLLNSLTELGLSNINVSNDEMSDKINAAFISFNEYSSIDSSKRKLEYVYTSNIIKLIITNKLDDILSNSGNLQNHPDAKEFNSSLNMQVYKQSEISYLVVLLKLMDADSIENVSLDELKINDLLTEFYSEDYTCSSKLLLSILSRNVLNFANDVIVVPTKAYSINNSEYKVLNDTESYILIDFCSSVLGADATVGSIESDLINSINDLALNNISDFHLSGDIIRASISNVAINAFNDSSLFDSAVINSCLDEDGILINSEIKSIIDFVNFSDIDVANSNFDNLTNFTKDVTQITKIRQDGEEFEGYSLLDLAYKSTIIKDYFNKKVDNALFNFASKDDLDKCKEGKYYDIDELNYLLNSLTELGLSNINVSNDEMSDKINAAFISFNEYSSIDSSKTKLEYVYTSNIIKLIITKKLDDILSNSGNLQNHPDAKELNSSLNMQVYKQSEISDLVSLLKLLSADSIENVSLDELKINDLLTEFYPKDYACSSKLLLSILSKNILESAKGAIVVPSTAYSINNSEYKVLNDTESYILIDFCSSVLGVDATVGSIESDLINSINDLALNNISDFHLSGDIIRATISDALIKDSALIIPYEVLQKFDDVQMITFDELSGLLDICSAVDLTNISDLHTDISLEVEDLDLISVRNYVNMSKILQATVSDKILSNSNIVVPVKDLIITDSLNVSMISLYEFNALLTALASVGVNSLSVAKTLTVDVLNPASYYKTYGTEIDTVKAIASSSILRATITKNINLGENVQIIALQDEVDYGDDVKDFYGNKIAILKNTEVEHLLFDIGMYKDENNGFDNGSSDNPFDCSIDYDFIYEIWQAEKLELMLQSDIFRIAVSEVLIEKNIAYDMVDAYVIDTQDATRVAWCSNDAIENYFDSLLRS